MPKYYFILEGIDGVGKTTHIPFIAEYLQQQSQTVLTVR